MKLINYLHKSFQYRIALLKNALAKPFLWKPKIMTAHETVEFILKNHSSVSRFGDWEIMIMDGQTVGYQKRDIHLAQRMRRVFTDPADGLLLAIPRPLLTTDDMCSREANSWKRHLKRYRLKWFKYLQRNRIYGCAHISRFYTGYDDISIADRNIAELRKLWENREVVFIEGQYSRLGVGNECFKNVKSIQRIICPAENAFDHYNEIIAEATKLPHDKLLIIALGPTASCLADDLTRAGYQALDLGHIDVEYEWWRMKATKRVPVRGKYTSEAVLSGISTNPVNGELTEEEIEQYNSQIIAKVL
jgi:glycosyltransferase family protein